MVSDARDFGINMPPKLKPLALPPMILASGSPRRQELLRSLGLKFQVIPAQVEEVEPEFLTPRETCLLNACRKAMTLARRHPAALVIGADTIVCLGLRIFGKPASLDEARKTLAELAGKTHDVITGVCLVCQRRQRMVQFSVRTRVRFRSLKAHQIERYLKLVNPLDKAGGYAIQEHGNMLVEKISGSYSNVVGLPLERLTREIARFKI